MTPSPPFLTLPDEQEVRVAAESYRELAAYLATHPDSQRIQILDEKDHAHVVAVPTSALKLLVDALGELASGNAVKVMPVHAELTTQAAADLLNVSRPYLVKLLEEGAIPFHRTGSHRKVKFGDLMRFKDAREQASEKAMAELARLSQDLGMGYE